MQVRVKTIDELKTEWEEICFWHDFSEDHPVDPEEEEWNMENWRETLRIAGIGEFESPVPLEIGMRMDENGEVMS